MVDSGNKLYLDITALGHRISALHTLHSKMKSVIALLLLIDALPCLRISITAVQGQVTSQGSCSNAGVCSALWETDGDVTIGIVANFHTDLQDGNVYSPCSSFEPQDVELVEIVRWLFSKVFTSNYTSGIKLGVRVYDGCGRTDIAATSAISLLPYLRYANKTTPKQAIGILGIVTSSQAKRLLNTLEDTHVPLVSPTATAPSLSQSSRFFRTIPSDELQMKVLYRIIKSLQMKYIAVVYSDDQFGRQGIEEISREVKKNGSQVCIAYRTIIKSFHDAIRIVDNLINLQDTLNQKNLPVLFIGQYTNAKWLIQATGINELSHHLLWIFPDSVGIDASLFKGFEKVGRNSLSVSPYYNVVEEFRSYLIAELHNKIILQNIDESHSKYPPYYKEYVESLLSCSLIAKTCANKTLKDLNNAFSQSSYITTVVNSAFAFVEAIRILHAKKCGSSHGACSNLENTLKSTSDEEFIGILQSLAVNYTVETLPQFIQNLSGFQFATNGNLHIREDQNIYLIHNAKCQPECVFHIVGTATKDYISLEYEQVTFYLDHTTDEITLASQMPSIYCMRDCQDCKDLLQPVTPHASIWGENLIVAFVPVHKPGSGDLSCGLLEERQSVEDVEAMLYGIETFNNNTGPWKEKPVLAGHLGIIVFDSCQNPIHAASILSQWLEGVIKVYDLQGQYYDPKTCVGVIGGLYSATNLQILPISQKEFLLQIGYASSSLELPLNGSEFLRTIPADDIQAQAMVDLVKKLGFNAFSVLYADDSYGYHGYAQLVLKAEEAKLCINKAIEIQRNIDEHELSEVFATLLQAQETKIVIVFSDAASAEQILRTANKKLVRKKFIWFGSEGWGARDRLIDAETGNEALGIFVVDFPQATNANYSAYITQLKPNQNSRNMFFSEWWENHFHCRLPTAITLDPPNRCDDSLTIPPPSDVQTAILCLKATWTMALGLSSAFTEICGQTPLTSCSTVVRNKKAREIVAEEVRKTTLLEKGKEYKVYTERGDGYLKEELWNVQMVENDKEFVKVSEFSDKGLTLAKSTAAKFYDANGEETVRPESTCFQCNCIYKHPDEPLIKLNEKIQVNGQLNIIALLPLHRSIHTSKIDVNALMWSEQLIHSVQRVNRETFGGDLLGISVYDSYGDAEVASLQTMLAMNAGCYLRLKDYENDARNFVCLFTYGTGLDSVFANLALKRSMVHLNIGQTVSSLLKTNQHFYNLGINLEDELAALVAIAKHYQWTSLQIVYSNDEDSVYAKDTFLELARQNGLCSLESLSLDNFISAMWIFKPPVIVLFINDHEVVDLLNKIGSRLDGAVFMAWSKLTNSLSYIGGNSYKGILNNTIGVFPDNKPVDDTRPLILQNSDASGKVKNPWLDESVDFNAVKESYSGIAHIELVIQSIATALHSLMLAECGEGNRLCTGLTDKPDWRTKRLLHFLKKETNIFDESQYRMFTIRSFQQRTLYDDTFLDSEIGLYDSEARSVKITNTQLSSIYKRIKSSCKGQNCKSCPNKNLSHSTPGWAIFLIILVILLVGVVIALVLWILNLRRHHLDKHPIYDYPGPAVNTIQDEGPIDPNHLCPNTPQSSSTLSTLEQSINQLSQHAADDPYRMSLTGL